MNEAHRVQNMANGPLTSVSKPSNPKEGIGSHKLPLDLVPESAICEESLAFYEGALKYGRYNWRIAGVRASTYMAAMLRHAFKWYNGADADPATRVKHLASARACLGIIIDAEWCGMLNDDRPPVSLEMEEKINELVDVQAHLKKLFESHTPKQFTKLDKPK